MAPLLYIASAIAESPSLDALPMVIVLIVSMLVVVGVLICFPSLVTFLPNLVFNK
jgi:TRAP-type C4-dicarboxylate transport system permease large subunit